MAIWLKSIGSIAGGFIVLCGSAILTIDVVRSFGGGELISMSFAALAASLCFVAYLFGLRWVEDQFGIRLIERQ